MKIDLEQIRDLLKAVSQTDITELTIESGEEKITVRKSLATAIASVSMPSETVVTLPQALPQIATDLPPQTAKPNNHKAAEAQSNAANNHQGAVPITSPMVGTFYRSGSPTAAPFVDVGDRVNIGQTVCIIEAMKLMNDLPAEVSGKIVKVLVENGTTVEFGQQLFLVDPNG